MPPHPPLLANPCSRESGTHVQEKGVKTDSYFDKQELISALRNFDEPAEEQDDPSLRDLVPSDHSERLVPPTATSIREVTYLP